MKTKLIITTLIICVSVSSSIAGTPKKPGVNEISKTVSLTSDYNKISVGEKLSIVFKNISGSIAVAQGNSKFISGVNFNVVNGTLFVTANGNAAFYSGTIYLPAKNLVEINVKSDAKIYSDGFMKCDNLIVYISNGSHAELKSQGKLAIKASEGAELDFQKYSTINGTIINE